MLPFWGSLYNVTSKVKVEVEEDAQIFFLPIQKAKLFIREYPQWMDYVLLLFVNRYEDLLNVIDIAFKRTDERLLSFLRNRAEITQSRSIIITHEQLAKELLTARVVVSRLLKQLEEKGLVQLSRNKITLSDQTDLLRY